jgi:streptogramin lyase
MKLVDYIANRSVAFTPQQYRDLIRVWTWPKSFACLRPKVRAPSRIAALCLCVCALLLSIPILAQESLKTISGTVQTAGTNNGPASQALFSDPTGIAVAVDGSVYIADNQNHTIRKISANSTVETFAGKAGEPGNANGPKSEARFDSPSGIVVAPDGTLFVTDTGNHTIRCISANGDVSTIAGIAGQSDFANGIGSDARFNSPLGIARSTSGTLYVADSGNHVVRAIAPDNTVTTLAGEPEVWGSSDGTGAAAHFNNPVGIAMDSHGAIFVADANNYTIRKISSLGEVTTFVGLTGKDGSADGPGTQARFGKPAELAIDSRDNLYVTDSLNHTIRKITSAGFVSTVAGLVGRDGSNDGVNGAGRFFNPYGIAVSPKGELFIADTYNQTIRKLLAPFSLAVLSDGNGKLIEWESVAGKSYQVQYKNGLKDSTWSNLGSAIQAAGTTTAITDISEESRFYRIQLVGD